MIGCPLAKQVVATVVSGNATGGGGNATPHFASAYATRLVGCSPLTNEAGTTVVRGNATGGGEATPRFASARVVGLIGFSLAIKAAAAVVGGDAADGCFDTAPLLAGPYAYAWQRITNIAGPTGVAVGAIPIGEGVTPLLAYFCLFVVDGFANITCSTAVVVGTLGLASA